MPKFVKDRAKRASYSSTAVEEASTNKVGQTKRYHPLTGLSAEQWAHMRHHTVTSYLRSDLRLTRNKSSNADISLLTYNSQALRTSRYALSVLHEPTPPLQPVLTIFDHELVAAGLAINSTRTSSIYERFRNRLMIPIRDVSHRVLGFGSRELPEQVANAIATRHHNATHAADLGFDQPARTVMGKYINSPSSSGKHAFPAALRCG
jgi:hypothetical protein